VVSSCSLRHAFAPEIGLPAEIVKQGDHLGYYPNSRGHLYPQRCFVEAARYALLRRLVPSISHDLTGALQPVNMMAAILEKRIKTPSPGRVVITARVTGDEIIKTLCFLWEETFSFLKQHKLLH